MQEITADKLFGFHSFFFDLVFITAIPVIEGDFAVLN